MFQVVYGGSASGKSAFAEQLVMEQRESKSADDSPRIYIATMYPFDDECRKRIEKHRIMRAEKKFETIECYTGLKSIQLPERAVVLLECMSNLVANERYQKGGAGNRTVEEVLEGICRLKEQAKALIVVTNNVFCDGTEYDEDTMEYLKELGAINQAMGEMADEVIEVICGIPVWQKGGNHEYI